MTLGERIKKVRKRLDLTQQKFADQIGTTQNNIASYEIGRREPSAAAVNNICKTFNVSETWLRTGEGEMFVERTRDDELAAFMDELLAGESAGFRRRLVTALSRLKPEQWEALETVALELAKGSAAPAFVPDPPAPTIEEEARAEAQRHAELIYQQILSEKRAAAGLSSESSGPPAGGGTTKQA